MSVLTFFLSFHSVKRDGSPQKNNFVIYSPSDCCNQTSYFCCMLFKKKKWCKTMGIETVWLTMFIKISSFVFHWRNSCRFRMTWGWVNIRIFIFVGELSLECCTNTTIKLSKTLFKGFNLNKYFVMHKVVLISNVQVRVDVSLSFIFQRNNISI